MLCFPQRLPLHYIKISTYLRTPINPLSAALAVCELRHVPWRAELAVSKLRRSLFFPPNLPPVMIGLGLVLLGLARPYVWVLLATFCWSSPYVVFAYGSRNTK